MTVKKNITTAKPWHLADSLVIFRREINLRWPNRQHESDGSIGNEEHAKTISDHNPNKRGSVNAIDVDADGVDMYAIIEQFEDHPSASYWIYRDVIALKSGGWRRESYEYAGPKRNRHTKHAHFSIKQMESAEENKDPWGIYPILDTNKGAFMSALSDAQQEDLARKVSNVYAAVFGGGPSCGAEVDPDNNSRGKNNSLVNKLDYLIERLTAVEARLKEMEQRA